MEIIHILRRRYHPKIMKLKGKSHRYDLNRPRPRHGHEYKYKKCLNMMMLICIKQHLN